MKHSVVVDQHKCRGCTTCIKNCPTDAIRVRQGKAIILGNRCIDCGNCVRVCPHKAIKTVSDSFDKLSHYKYCIALPDPALYAQFHNMENVDIVLNGLKQIGFHQVWEVSKASELLAYYAREGKKNHIYNWSRPTISSACPAVVRLIRIRFPKLINHIGTVLMPAEIAALLAREEAMEQTGLTSEEIGVFLISPCPAKVTACQFSEGLNRVAIDGAFSIRDIYLRILNPMRDLTELEPICSSGYMGISWATTTGESLCRQDENYIAVDGIHHVIQLLEEVEDGMIPEVDFLELHACTMGCLGGCLNVENPFVAKMRLEQVMRTLPEHGDRYFISEREESVIQYERELEYSPVFVLDENRAAAMEKLCMIDDLRAKLPGLDCGSCGAPSCMAHAEDVVMGRANENDCIFRLRERMRNEVKDGDEYIPLPFRSRKAQPGKKGGEGT